MLTTSTDAFAIEFFGQFLGHLVAQLDRPELVEDVYRLATGVVKLANAGCIPSVDRVLEEFERRSWLSDSRTPRDAWCLPSGGNVRHLSCRFCEKPRLERTLGREQGALVADYIDAIRRRDRTPLGCIHAMILHDLDERHPLSLDSMRQGFVARARELGLASGVIRRVSKALVRPSQGWVQLSLPFLAVA